MTCIIILRQSSCTRISDEKIMRMRSDQWDKGVVNIYHWGRGSKERERACKFSGCTRGGGSWNHEKLLEIPVSSMGKKVRGCEILVVADGGAAKIILILAESNPSPPPIVNIDHSLTTASFKMIYWLKVVMARHWPAFIVICLVTSQKFW